MEFALRWGLRDGRQRVRLLREYATKRGGFGELAGSGSWGWRVRFAMCRKALGCTSDEWLDVDGRDFSWVWQGLRCGVNGDIAGGDGRQRGQPVMSRVNKGVSVALYCADPKTIVFYAMDESLPTTRSQRDSGPMVLRANVRVRAMAFDLESMPSGVVSKTIRAGS